MNDTPYIFIDRDCKSRSETESTLKRTRETPSLTRFSTFPLSDAGLHPAALRNTKHAIHTR